MCLQAWGLHRVPFWVYTHFVPPVLHFLMLLLYASPHLACVFRFSWTFFVVYVHTVSFPNISSSGQQFVVQQMACSFFPKMAAVKKKKTKSR
uniref:Uncharacterized protein n=1 Tax=Amblyomma triste TaxID=251400 RepID=A0A023G197_AMBTT